ncbi:hypothetical protein CCACVL1_18014 [Corchorus capsularis]|uniref:Uncharacterized protein n=1 Tax=Corchorus capsularis TaxID=210143 RepID=A0A1R3HP64_COCAP|nr:hypothetical protein CCACVL1_18014 [Corchorus capsularis]
MAAASYTSGFIVESAMLLLD